MYFYANRHLRALTLDGTPVFEVPGGLAALEPSMSPAIGPDGSVHTDLNAYTPAGSLQWSFPTPEPYNVFTNPDVGSDGFHYFGQNLSQLFALNPDGSLRWHVALADYVGGPIVDPTNTQLLMGGADTLDHPASFCRPALETARSCGEWSCPSRTRRSGIPTSTCSDSTNSSIPARASRRMGRPPIS